jgi:hypothetical protein
MSASVYDLAAEAAATPSVLNYMPHPGFRDYVLRELREGYHTIKAIMSERHGDAVTVWTWVADPEMSYLSNQSLAHRAREEVVAGEHVHRVSVTEYGNPGPVGGRVSEYVYHVSR